MDHRVGNTDFDDNGNWIGDKMHDFPTAADYAKSAADNAQQSAEVLQKRVDVLTRSLTRLERVLVKNGLVTPDQLKGRKKRGKKK